MSRLPRNVIEKRRLPFDEMQSAFNELPHILWNLGVDQPVVKVSLSTTIRITRVLSNLTEFRKGGFDNFLI